MKIVKNKDDVHLIDLEHKEFVSNASGESIHDRIPHLLISMPTEEQYRAALFGASMQHFLESCCRGLVVLRTRIDEDKKERWRIIANYYFLDVEFFTDDAGHTVMTTLPNHHIDRAKVVEEAKALLGCPDWLRKQRTGSPPANDPSSLISSNLPAVTPDDEPDAEKEDEACPTT